MGVYVYVSYYNKWDVVYERWTSNIDRIFKSEEDALAYARRFNRRRISHGIHCPFKTIGKRTLY